MAIVRMENGDSKMRRATKRLLSLSEMHESAKCRQGQRCIGPGCNINTGKTERKENWKRSKANKRGLGK